MNLGERGDVVANAPAATAKSSVDSVALALIDGLIVGTDIVVPGGGLRIGLGESIQGQGLPQQFQMTEALPVPLSEGRMDAGALDDWGVPDDLTSVNGRLPWTRVIGTNWVVQNGRARLLPGSGAFEFARCDRDLASSDMDVSITIPTLSKVDSPLVAAAVLARVDPGGATTFYQARAVSWNAGDFCDLWRVVANAWTRIAGPFSLIPGPNERLRMRVTGTPNPTVQMWIGANQVVLPTLDVGGIASGARFGIFGEIDSGTQAIVEIDDALAVVLPAPVSPILVSDAVVMKLVEAFAGGNVLLQAEALAIGIGEFPIDTFVAKFGADAPRVALSETGAVVQIAAPIMVADSLAVALFEGAVETNLADGSTLPVRLIESASIFALADVKAGADPVAVRLAGETASVAVTTFLVQATGSDSVAIPISEAAQAGAVAVQPIAGNEALPVPLQDQAQPVQVARTAADGVAVGIQEAGTAVANAPPIVSVIQISADQMIQAGGDTDGIIVAGPSDEAVVAVAGPQNESFQIGGE